MDLFELTGFNTSDDASFSNLMDSHAIRSRNRLFNVLPSSLDFMYDCWATQDLFVVSYQEQELDEIDYLTFVGNALAPALPFSVNESSLFDKNEYWQALLDLTTTPAVLQKVLRLCHASSSFRLPQLDFLANCSTTAYFWSQEIFPSQPRAINPDAWTSLFRSSLPLPYAGMSDSTIASMVALLSLPNNTLTNDTTLAFRQSVENAAAVCANLHVRH